MTEQKQTLLEKFMKLNSMMLKNQFINFKMHGPYGNPQRGQGRVLSILNMKSEITQKELAFLLDMRNQSLGELLAKLEKKGFITREQSEKDKRAMIVKITEKGKDAAEKVNNEQVELDRIFDCLTEEEQKNLDVYITKLIKEMYKRKEEFEGSYMTEEQHAKFRKGFEKMHRHFRENHNHDFEDGCDGPFSEEGEHPFDRRHPGRPGGFGPRDHDGFNDEFHNHHDMHGPHDGYDHHDMADQHDGHDYHDGQDQQNQHDQRNEHFEDIKKEDPENDE